MTPKPESETDPWAKVDEDHEGKCWMDDVKVARAAEAAQHRHEIAAIAGCDGQCSCAIFTRHDAAMALFKEMDEVKALSADLAAVEAERDQAQRALATAYLKARRQASVCEPNEDQFAGAMAVVAAAFPNTRVEATAVRIAKPEEPTELVVAVKRRAERAEAERDRLKAALERLRDCDWTIGRGDRMDAVRDIARAALTPQGQSTDGETR